VAESWLGSPKGFDDAGPWVAYLPNMWRGLQEYTRADSQVDGWQHPVFPGRDDHPGLIAWWSPLLQLIAYALGSTSPTATLAELCDHPELMGDDPRLRFIMDWWGEHLPGFVSWALETNLDYRAARANPYPTEPGPPLARGHLVELDRGARRSLAATAGLDLDDGSDRLHLVSHSDVGLRDGEGREDPMDLSAAEGVPRIRLAGYGGFYRQLAELIPPASGLVDVVIDGIGRLGTFTVHGPGSTRPAISKVDSLGSSTSWTGTFSPYVAEKLGWYVYALRDPRDKKIFYIGKGIGQRVFQHAQDAEADELVESHKFTRIRDIHAAGHQVDTIILRHRISNERMAYEVEAAVIDAMQIAGVQLTNVVVGHGKEFAAMTAQTINALYETTPAPPITEPCVLLKIPQIWSPTMTDAEVYEATRGWWALSVRLGTRAKYAFTVSKGVIRAAYRIERWRERVPGDRDYSEKDLGKRLGLIGEPAPELSSLLNHSITHLKMSSGSPVIYLNCDDEDLPQLTIARGAEALLLAESERTRSIDSRPRQAFVQA
jgi:uncharacterized protein